MTRWMESILASRTAAFKRPGGLFASAAAVFSVLVLHAAPSRAANPDSLLITIPIVSSAPADVVDLVASQYQTTNVPGAIDLTWTEPGDDGYTGTAASFTVKVSTNANIDNDAQFNAAQPLSSFSPTPSPTPSGGGSTRTDTITGLTVGQVYYFAIRATDAQSNSGSWSRTLGKNATNYAVAPGAPADITDLTAVTGSQSGSIQLTWTQPGDDANTGSAASYAIKVSSTANITNDAAFAAAQALSVFSPTAVPSPGTPLTQASLTVNGLIPGVTYYFAIRATDDDAPAPRTNSWSSTVLINPNNFAPAAVDGAPNAPTLGVDASQVATTQIRWTVLDNAANETALYVNLTASTSTRLSSNLGPLSGTGGTASFVESGLSVNRPYTRTAEAFNLIGSSFSAEVTRYTLAMVPTGTQAVDASSVTLTVAWGANGNPASTLYEVQFATQSSFAGALAVTVAQTTATLTNLAPNTAYWVRVRAFNGDLIATSYDVTISPRTRPLRDAVPPKAPAGVWAEWISPDEGRMRLHWHDVRENADGTAFDDPAAEPYKIYRSETVTQSASDPAPQAWGVSVAAAADGDLFTTDAVDPDRTYYYRLRAVDASGNESEDSMIVEVNASGRVLNVFSLADDQKSRLVIPAEVARAVLSKDSNGMGDDLIIKAVEVPEEEKGRVVKSIRFEAYKAGTNEPVRNFALKAGLGTAILVYSVQNGQVVQGAPGVSGIAGAPLAEAAKAPDQLSLFWHNGVEWVKVGGVVDAASHEVRLRTTRAGRYQIRQAIRIGPASLTRVYPRTFTPNGDGWNDKVIFEFDNPALLPLKGEVFDVSGAKVSDLVPGPSADSTLMWDGKRGGQPVPAGVYIYQIEIGGETANGTVVVAK